MSALPKLLRDGDQVALSHPTSPALVYGNKSGFHWDVFTCALAMAIPFSISGPDLPICVMGLEL